jgi:pimeloyl-ACP methyl ester carboxylesterase
MDGQGLDSVSIFGYSMGGYVALYLALRHPGRVRSIATLATKMQWDPETAARETGGLNPDTILAKVPRFAEMLQKRHHPQDWKELLSQTAGLMRGLGDAPPLTDEVLQKVEQPVLMMRGDRDAMVTLEETVSAYKSLPNASLAILPGTPHPLEKVNIPVLGTLVRSFFASAG